jgi:DNA-3-methyladenine glycosylase II
MKNKAGKPSIAGRLGESSGRMGRPGEGSGRAGRLEEDLVMAGVIKAVGPCKLVANFEGTPFEALASAIAHQQLHGAAARTILKRFVDQVGGGKFPTPQQVLDAPDSIMRGVGFSTSKTAALRDLAAKTIEGIVPNREELMSLDDATIIERLTQVRGIGRWTVEMLLIFNLGRPDILPVDDFGVREGFRRAYGLRKMPSPKALAAYGERWSPHRSTAAWYLWRAVELHRAGNLPAPCQPTRLPRIKRLRRAAKRLKTKAAAKISRVRARVRARRRAKR